MELEPINDTVLIKPIDRQPRKTGSGILLADPKFEGVPISGIIHSLPESVPDGYSKLKVGDRVIFEENHAPKAFHYSTGGEKQSFFVVRFDKILAIVGKDVELWG